MYNLTTSLPHAILINEFLPSDKKLNYHLVYDLIDTMHYIYHQDISVPRKVDGLFGEIKIPVSDTCIWNSVKNEIVELCNWVSEGDIDIKFIQTNKPFVQSPPSLFKIENNYPVSLFSGGLDSFSGLFFNYANGIKSDFVGFKNKDEEGKKQEQLMPFYSKIFPSSSIHLVSRIERKKQHPTQSTRSLLYLALAVCKAISNKNNKVFLFENGILSLNPEINSRYTTKTTHPKTIYLYNYILEKIGLNVMIESPFQFLTKGQIVNEMNLDFKKQIEHTFTCGSNRQSMYNKHKGHCGICIPCILRKISTAAYDLEPYDTQYHYKFDVQMNDFENDNNKNYYISNIDYFRQYVNLINEGTIFNHTLLTKKYFPNNKDYLFKYSIMFKVFSQEFERFWSKYALR